jgi:hypothetical protein
VKSMLVIASVYSSRPIARALLPGTLLAWSGTRCSTTRSASGGPSS